MDKKARMTTILLVLAASLVAAGLVLAGDSPECNDGIDNDGDNATDYPADAGCTSLNDTDESNCGDGVCEGGETSSTCPADCPGSWSCIDTDGGFIVDTYGYVYATNGNQNQYAQDNCLSSELLSETYCSAGRARQASYNCSATNGTYTGCSNGACY